MIIEHACICNAHTRAFSSQSGDPLVSLYIKRRLWNVACNIVLRVKAIVNMCDPHYAWEVRAVCNGTPCNAHAYDSGTRIVQRRVPPTNMSILLLLMPHPLRLSTFLSRRLSPLAGRTRASMHHLEAYCCSVKLPPWRLC